MAVGIHASPQAGEANWLRSSDLGGVGWAGLGWAGLGWAGQAGQAGRAGQGAGLGWGGVGWGLVGGGFVQRSGLHRQAQYEKNTVAAFTSHSIPSSEC